MAFSTGTKDILLSTVALRNIRQYLRETHPKGFPVQISNFLGSLGRISRRTGIADLIYGQVGPAYGLRHGQLLTERKFSAGLSVIAITTSCSTPF